MKSLILSLMLIFSINTFAESPIIFSEEDSKFWNSSMAESSIQTLLTWITENKTAIDQFGGTKDGVCSSLSGTGEVFLATHAYRFKGTFALGLEHTDGFAQISRAKISEDNLTLYLSAAAPILAVIKCKM